MKRERSSSSSSSQLHDDPLMMQLNKKNTHHNHNHGSSYSNGEKIRATTTKILPQEIIDEILYRLPVKSLLRFKCVSKRWLSALSDSNFNLYYKKSSSVFTIRLNRNIPSLYYIGGDNASFIKAFSLNLPPFILEEYNNNNFLWERTISNACNGLVLLRISKDSLVLFNPSTRCYSLNALTLDCFDSTSTVCYTSGIGLCYDANINDYKAVIIINLVYNAPRAFVSCLKSKRWVEITHVSPFDLGYLIRGPLVNGHIHWTTETTIAYFEVTRNTFEPLLSPPDHHQYFIIGSGVLDECLCIARRRRSIIEDDVEVVAMKKYGVAESWTTLYVLSILNVSSSFWDLCPLLLTKNGEEVLFMSKLEEIWAYNPTCKSHRKFDKPDDEFLCATSVVQTIVSPAVVLDAEQ
ncbi:hypothetical protein LguiB_027555 [Lonicera macranthoides]